MLYAWEKFGLKDAEKEYNEKYSMTEKAKVFEEVVRGKIGFIRHVKGPENPVFKNLAQKFNTLTTSTKIQTEPTIEEYAKLATWIIETDTNQGTAFFVEKFVLVTCRHCLADKMVIFHPSEPSKKYPVKAKTIDDDRDLAILEAPEELTKKVKPLKIAAYEKPKDGADVILMGYPNHQIWRPIRVEDGKVIRCFPNSGVQFIEVSTKIIEGNSGGPLLDGDMKVVGIAARGLNPKIDVKSAEFFAISVKELQHLK